MKVKKDILIVGAGITGAVIAQRCAAAGKTVALIDKREEIGGNCFDYKDENGIFVHKYGPHIMHTDDKNVWEYLSQFTQWLPYQHKVLGYIDGQYVPIPFNLNTLRKLFSEEQAKSLEKKLVAKFGLGKKVPILELRKSNDKDLHDLADFVYEKVFLHYTQKQWGVSPEEIDPEVTGRVPVLISRDDRYFQDRFQGIPADGYTSLIENIVKNKNIELFLDLDFVGVKEKFEYKTLVYTGPIDEYFDLKFGKLSYRYFIFDIETVSVESFQPAAVVNYPNDNDFTRITEFKKFTGVKSPKTVIGREYPGNEGVLGWPMLNESNKSILNLYQKEAEKLTNVFFAGRLGEFKYYDMDDAVKNAFKMSQKILYGTKQ